jgi:hypothetical protein
VSEVRSLSALLSMFGQWRGLSVASRRAWVAVPGGVRLVQVERPTGRTTWTRRARSGWLWRGLRTRVTDRSQDVYDTPSGCWWS